MKYLFCFIIFFFTFTSRCSCKDLTSIKSLHIKGTVSQDLNPYLLYYRTPYKNVETDSIIIYFRNGQFRDWSKERLKQFYNDDQYWFCFSLRNQFPALRSLLLSVKGKGYSVTVYKLDRIHNHLVQFDSTSVHTPLIQRPQPFRKLTFEIEPTDTVENVYFLKVQKTMVRNAIFKFQLSDTLSYLRDEMTEHLLMFLYVGFFLIALIFHLLLYLVFKEPLHGWQTVYISSSLVFTIYLFDFHAYLLPDGIFPVLSSIPTTIMPYTCVTILIIVYIHLLDTRKYPIIHKSLLAAAGFSIFSIMCSIASYVLYYHMEETKFRVVDNALRIPTFLNFLIYGPTLFISSTYLLFRASPPLKIFLTAIIASLTFWVITYLEMAGKIDVLIIPPNNMVATYGIEIVTFLLITIYIFWNERKEKLELFETKLKLQKKLIEDVVKAEEQERKRIAQELHDGLGGYLMGIRLMVNRNRNEPQEIDSLKLLSNLEGKLDKAVSDVRIISHNLMPSDFNQLEFTSILKEHLSTLNENGEIAFEYFFDEKLNSLEKSIQITVYRILSELIRNIQTHAQATAATVQIVIHPQQLIMHVEDNGHGFDVESKRSGIGLKSIQLRVEYLNGTMNVESGKLGTNVIIEIPINITYV